MEIQAGRYEASGKEKEREKETAQQVFMSHTRILSDILNEMDFPPKGKRVPLIFRCVV